METDDHVQEVFSPSPGMGDNQVGYVADASNAGYLGRAIEGVGPNPAGSKLIVRGEVAVAKMGIRVGLPKNSSCVRSSRPSFCSVLRHNSWQVLWCFVQRT